MYLFLSRRISKARGQALSTHVGGDVETSSALNFMVAFEKFAVGIAPGGTPAPPWGLAPIAVRLSASTLETAEP